MHKIRIKHTRHFRVSFFVGTAVLALMFGLVSMAVKLQSPAHAAGVPFTRGQGLVFVSQGDPTRLFESVQLPGTNSTSFSPVGPAQSITYNAMGFNPADMYLYAINSSNNRLIQIDSTGTTTGLGTGAVANLPVLSGQQTYNAGTIGNCTPANTLWIASSAGGNHIYSIDVTAARPTAVALTLSTSIPNLADFVCQDGYLWGVYGGGGTTAASPNGMYRINITTGQVDWFSLAGVITTDWGNSFGAQWLYGNGNLGISNNASGNIHQIQINNPTSATPTFAEVAVLKGPASTTNDGASYQGDPVDLSVTKTVVTDYGPSGTLANNDTYTPGSNATYTLTVKNASTTGANSSGFYVTDTLDARIDSSNVTFDNSACYISQVGVVNVTSTVVTCVAGALAAGQSTSFDIHVITPVTHDISIVNTATVTGDETDPNLANNTDSVSIDAAPSGYIISKTAEIEGGHVNARPGETILYTITVKNTGATAYTAPNLATFSDDISDVLDDATLVSPLTSGLTLAGTTLNWAGELAMPGSPGDTVAVQYEVTINTPDNGNKIMNNFITATGDDGGCSGPCATQTIVGIPGYSINKTVSTTKAHPGDLVTYNIVVTNTGTAPYTARYPITIVDDLSDVLDDTVFTGTMSDGASISGSTLTWVGPLDVGQSTTISYTVRVTNPAEGNLVMNNLIVPQNGEGSCISCTTQTVITVPTPPVNPGPSTPIPGLPNTGLARSLDFIGRHWYLPLAAAVIAGAGAWLLRKKSAKV